MDTPTPETLRHELFVALALDGLSFSPEVEAVVASHESSIATLRVRLVQMERALADRDRRIDEGDAIPASFYKRLEAEERAHHLTIEAWLRDGTELDALRTRLEAAEKLVADTFAYLTKWGELGWMRATDEDEGTNLADRLEAASAPDDSGGKNANSL